MENKVVHISLAYVMRRSDKQADRVEISPEQLSAAAIEAEVSAQCEAGHKDISTQQL